MTAQLASRLRAGTHDLHRHVEQTPFVAALIAGRLTREPYALLLRNLEPIYRTLEQALDAQASHPAVAPIRCTALYRSGALVADLQALCGAAWAARDVLPATEAYAAHLKDLQDAAPERLAAHAYVRYLGDLNGGQMLRGSVRRALALPPDGTDGTAFYDFGEASAVKQLGSAFRDGLNALPTDDDLLVAEARLAFGLHALLFSALARASGLGAASVFVDEAVDGAVEVGRAPG